MSKKQTENYQKEIETNPKQTKTDYKEMENDK